MAAVFVEEVVEGVGLVVEAFDSVVDGVEEPFVVAVAEDLVVEQVAEIVGRAVVLVEAVVRIAVKVVVVEGRFVVDD